MANLNKPLENPLAKVFDLKTLFNEEIFDEGYEITCSEPGFISTNIKRGGVIRLGANGNVGVYYLRFYMPGEADIPANEQEQYKNKMIMTYCFDPYLYNGVPVGGYNPANYDGFADFTQHNELAFNLEIGTKRVFQDRLKEWVTKTSIPVGGNAASLPTASRSINFTMIGRTTQVRKKMKTFTIDFNHIKS